MPSSYDLLPRGILLSQIKKFIPKKWKQSVEKTSDELMVDNLLITLKNFVSQGNLSEAFKSFSHIRSHVSNDILVQSLSSLLLCCTNLKSLSQGKQIHAHLITLGHGKTRFWVPKLITFYTAFDLISTARIIAETSYVIHPLPWNLLISAYVKNGSYENALRAYKRMMSKGIKPDEYTYPSVLKACGEQLDLKFGLMVHKSIAKTPSIWNLVVQNALISMYTKCGEVKTAREIFDKMLVKDAVTWNSIIAGYASKGIWVEAFHLFEKMREDLIELNIITWNTISGGCLKTGNFKNALELIIQMNKSGIELDPVAVIIGLSACSHLNLPKPGKELHGLSIRRFYDEYNNVKNALINMYARCENLVIAYTLFRSVQVKSVITWNTIISGYTHWNRFDEAIFLFREMLFSKLKPNFVTIASILPICARVANLQHGKEFHGFITRHEEFTEHLLLWNSLVDMYARSGKLVLAKKLFDSMSKKDEVTYTSIIAGYGIQGEGKFAIKLFDEMIKHEIKPDKVTMIAVLSACSHSGLVLQGKLLFEKMQIIYDIVPCLEHYACMVDLYGRAGLLKKAEGIIVKMPFQPSAEMWATLIGACKIHGNMEIGEWAAEKLLEMKPENSGYYVLIGNMYGAAKCWEKLGKVRTLMRDLGVRKDPGCAWIDIGGGFLPFVVGDDSLSNESDEMSVLLRGLNKHMKDVCYIGCLDEDLSCLVELTKLKNYMSMWTPQKNYGGVPQICQNVA